MATCPDNFAHMADDLEQNMILNGENDLGKYLQKMLSILFVYFVWQRFPGSLA